MRTIWTDEVIADVLARPGYLLETPEGVAKWEGYYRELDALLEEQD